MTIAQRLGLRAVAFCYPDIIEVWRKRLPQTGPNKIAIHAYRFVAFSPRDPVVFRY